MSTERGPPAQTKFPKSKFDYTKSGIQRRSYKELNDLKNYLQSIQGSSQTADSAREKVITWIDETLESPSIVTSGQNSVSGSVLDDSDPEQYTSDSTGQNSKSILSGDSTNTNSEPTVGRTSSGKEIKKGEAVEKIKQVDVSDFFTNVTIGLANIGERISADTSLDVQGLGKDISEEPLRSYIKEDWSEILKNYKWLNQVANDPHYRLAYHLSQATVYRATTNNATTYQNAVNNLGNKIVDFSETWKDNPMNPANWLSFDSQEKQEDGAQESDSE